MGIFLYVGDSAQLLIDRVEQGRDQLHRGHAALSSQGKMSHRPAWKSRLTTASSKTRIISFCSSIFLN